MIFFEGINNNEITITPPLALMTVLKEFKPNIKPYERQGDSWHKKVAVLEFSDTWSEVNYSVAEIIANKHKTGKTLTALEVATYQCDEIVEYTRNFLERYITIRGIEKKLPEGMQDMVKDLEDKLLEDFSVFPNPTAKKTPKNENSPHSQ
jgi:hypothetical protein